MDETIETITEKSNLPMIAVVAASAVATVVVLKVGQRVRARRWIKKHYG